MMTSAVCAVERKSESCFALKRQRTTLIRTSMNCSVWIWCIFLFHLLDDYVIKLNYSSYSPNQEILNITVFSHQVFILSACFFISFSFFITNEYCTMAIAMVYTVILVLIQIMCCNMYLLLCDRLFVSRAIFSSKWLNRWHQACWGLWKF